MRRAYAGWSGPPRHESHGSHEISGTAPRPLILLASARGKSGECSQSANVPTIAARAPTADSASSSAPSDGTFMPNSGPGCGVVFALACTARRVTRMVKATRRILRVIGSAGYFHRRAAPDSCCPYPRSDATDVSA